MAADVFGTAPRELTSAITLQQTLDLIRSVVDVVEDEVDQVADDDAERVRLREAVLRYSREIAFAAAEVYAQAAEARGAWDARLESLVVDAVLRGEADDSMQSRAAALGWGSVSGRDGRRRIRPRPAVNDIRCRLVPPHGRAARRRGARRGPGTAPGHRRRRFDRPRWTS